MQDQEAGRLPSVSHLSPVLGWANLCVSIWFSTRSFALPSAFLPALSPLSEVLQPKANSLLLFQVSGG